jgi:serine/threonine protein kinase
VKPENLLLHEDGQVLLADFGIPAVQQAQERDVMELATWCYMIPEHSEEGYKESDQRALALQADKIVEPEEPIYSNQYTLDTMAYMAPERFEGRVSAASDQYALGIIVYEWMTGQTPSFVSPQDSWVNWAQQNQKEELLDPIAAIPREVKQVISKALAKRPDDRYVDVATFAASLQIAMERSKEKDKGSFYPVAWYKQQLEEYERVLRDEHSSEQEMLLEEEKPLAVTIECLIRPYMEKALAYLSWVERSCLLLHVDTQFELEEIAEILRIPEESVHEHLENGRRQLLQTYDTLLNEEQGFSPSQVPVSTEEDTFRVERLIRSLSQLPSTEPLSSFRPPLHPLRRNKGSRGLPTIALTRESEETGRPLHEGRGTEP